ncbi:cyclic nucleotide-binding domain-containing protein [bacterium]|jgi:CRP-like cAMP-binding protein|nr:cyclic nucleotide-binding domain-containing protein [bacterium]MBT4649281.1 cyclic nucleotide-binding domain-containing protein [bacterium]
MNGFNLELTPLLRNLNKAEIKIVENFLIEKNYTNGDLIFKKDAIRDKVVIVKNGLVQLKTDVADHQETIALFKDGDFLGEMAFLEKGSKHNHTLEVASPRLTTIELSVYNWFKILKQHPVVAQKIYHNIAVDLKKRLDHANNKLVTLFAGGKIIASYDNLTDISQHIIEVINRVIPVNKALFLTASSTSQKLTVRHSFGYKNLPINTYLNINKDPLLGKLYLEPKTKIFYKHDWTKEYNELPYVANSLIVAPIILTKKAIGFIILGDKNNGRDFSMNNQILLDAIATQIAPALEEQRLSNLKASADDLKRVYIEPFA